MAPIVILEGCATGWFTPTERPSWRWSTDWSSDFVYRTLTCEISREPDPHRLLGGLAQDLLAGPRALASFICCERLPRRAAPSRGSLGPHGLRAGVAAEERPASAVKKKSESAAITSSQVRK